MIVDIHTHIGNGFGINMSEQLLLDSLTKYHIDFALTSNADGCDFNNKGESLNNSLTQTEINNRSIRFALQNKERIGVLMWVMAYSNTCDREFCEMAQKYRDIIYGLKVHPTYCGVAFNDSRMEPYIQFAREFDFPILVHTAKDTLSKVKHVFEMAKKYPDVKFIMSHLGFGTNNKEAIEYLKHEKNLYADTAWVRPSKIKMIVDTVGYDRILFGSDNPTIGIDTYAHKACNAVYLNEFADSIFQEAYDSIMFRNAFELFKLKKGN